MLRSFSVASLCLFACACSGADPTVDEAPPASEAPNSETLAGNEEAASSASTEQLLHQLSFEDLEISFYWMGPGSVGSEDGSIGIEEGFVAVDYVGALRQEYGPVTSLELFKAFAPAGAEPNPVLLARHEAEASAYGRRGAGLEVLDVDGRTLEIDKAIPADCESFILPNISPGSYTEKQVTDGGADGLFVYTCVGDPKVSGVHMSESTSLGCERHPAARELTVGLCSDAASVQAMDWYTQQVSSLGTFTTTHRGLIKPTGKRRFTLAPLAIGTPRGLGVIGLNGPETANFHRQYTGLGVYPL